MPPKDDAMTKNLPIITSEKVADLGGRSQLRRVAYTFPDQTSHAYDIFDLRKTMQGSAALLPIDDEGNIYLIEEFLAAEGKFGLSLARGGIEVGEDPAVAALRELQEEAGLTCEKVVPLWAGCVIPSASSWHVHIFLGYGVRTVPQTGGDEFGGTKTIKMPLADAVANVKSGKLPGALLGLAVLLAAQEVLG